MTFPVTRRAALAGAAAFCAAGRAAAAAGNWDLDAFVTRVMREFEVPGLALTIVQDGSPTHAKGYGVRRLGETAEVDEHTVFALASCSKAFTGAVLGMLVEEKKLGWDDPVVKHLPAFVMSDPAVTAEITVRDLLLHRSGLGLGSGDLMTWPATTHSRAEIIAGLKHLPLVRPFRSAYDYDNVLYIVAGEVAAAVSGRSWEALVAERILKPLGMTRSGPTADPAWLPSGPYAWPHARLGGQVRGLGPQRPLATSGRERTNNGPAGGIRSTARDAGRWLQVLLGGGQAVGAARLWSEQTHRELWRARTLIRDEGGSSGVYPDMPVMVAYASGWEVRDYRGHKLVWHAGQLNGQSANVVLLPSRSTGFAILSNAEEGNALRAIRNTLLDRILGHSDFDWLDNALGRMDGQNAGMKRAAAGIAAHRPSAAPSLPMEAYVGNYRDPWYGAVKVARAGDRLTMDFTRTPGMAGPLEPWDGETFRTRFADANFENALATFETKDGRAERITLKALSPSADFSYDFQDLDLRRAS